MIWRIVRVSRKGKRIRVPEIMHNRIEAESRAEALALYKQRGGSGELTDLEARVA